MADHNDYVKEIHAISGGLPSVSRIVADVVDAEGPEAIRRLQEAGLTPEQLDQIGEYARTTTEYLKFAEAVAKANKEA